MMIMEKQFGQRLVQLVFLLVLTGEEYVFVVEIIENRAELDLTDIFAFNLKNRKTKKVVYDKPN